MSNARLRLLVAADGPLRHLVPEQGGAALRKLFAPLDQLLISGGDARLAIDPASGRNAYGCWPCPAPEVLSFSSSTATSISPQAYERTNQARDALMRSAIAQGFDDAFEARMEEMRDELKAHLGLGATDTEVVFSASGTDAQLQSLFLARARLGAPLTTVVVAADQTGSGTVHTARGRHFGDATAGGIRVRKGEPIAGLADAVAGIAISLANADGGMRAHAETDALVLGAVERAIAAGDRVVVQVMDASKFGVRVPSDHCVREIAARWPDAVQIVVDACQMRLGRRRLGAYLDRGYMVLVTGSKYFTGPPFSGALLVPPAVASAVAAVDAVPAGLLDYSGRDDWPKRWGLLRSRFPARPNVGQWLRWEAALVEIGAYYGVPDAFRHAAVRDLGDGIARIVGASPSLRLLSLEPQPSDGSIDDEEFAAPTIVPFTIAPHGRMLAPDDCRTIYRALVGDAGDAAAADRSDTAPVAARDGLVGQPVELGGRNGRATAALRMSVDARHVAGAWSPDADLARRNLQGELGRAAAVVANIESLLGGADQRNIPAEGA